MNRKGFLIITIVLFCMIMAACSNDDSEDTYTVWTDSGTYENFQSTYKTTLNDGYYTRLQLTTSEWEQLVASAGTGKKQIWTKSTIKDWFLGRDFDDETATKSVAWLFTVEHGAIASRTGTIVYYILK